MLSQKLQDAFNAQINKELYSEYLYLSMAAYCYSLDLDGFANYFMVQTQEEHFHAMKMFNFVTDCGGKIILQPIAGPEVEFKSIVHVYEKTLEHERFVTQSINDLMSLAVKESDHASSSFLKWFIDEQVEEEATVSKILSKLKLIGGEGQGLLMLDTELAARVFTPPATTA
jgi:ferritin